ncbi:hypothetical protein RYZ26_17145 [Terasakiella sp. A23]|uniref:hypothetical protein n=1 Tax=Terasakiella sp. FCG-A23 TaxID=3080561 RepID=UPI0029554C04|nr:hypothetical protein [Terasakiella sp. A23]MDV7341338.1 hypothetical protein [Terasakiella sp. A23]
MGNQKRMSDEEFDEYLEEYWPFLCHRKGKWGPIDTPEAISKMTDEHIASSIAYISKHKKNLRYGGQLPDNPQDLSNLEELIKLKTAELEKELQSR